MIVHPWSGRRKRGLGRIRPTAEPLERRLLMTVIAGKSGSGVLGITEGIGDAATITAAATDGTSFTVTGTGIVKPINFTGISGISVSGPAPAMAASVSIVAPSSAIITLPGSIGVQFVSSVTFESPRRITAASVLVDLGTITLNTPGGISTTGQQAYLAPVTLAAGTTLRSSGSGNIVFAQPVNGAQDLTIDTGGTTVLGTVGNVTPLHSVTTDAGGTTSIVSVKTTAVQEYNDAVTLSADSTETASAVTFDGTVDGAFGLTVVAPSVQFLSPVGATKALAGLAAGSAVTVGGGSVTTTGAQSWNGPVTLTTRDATFTSTGNGNISFGKITGGGQALTVNTGGTTTFGGAADALSALTTDDAGTTTLSGGTITTSGPQTYNDAVSLGANAVLASTQSGDVTFAQNVTGAHALTVNTAGTTNFAAGFGVGGALASLTTDAPGATSVANFAFTTGDQTYHDPLEVKGAGTFNSSSGGNISFAQIDGTPNTGGNLVVETVGVTSFNGPVGAAVPIGGFSTDAGGSTVLRAGEIHTTAQQDFGDAVTLASDTTLSAVNASIVFRNTVDGAFALTLNGGSTSLAGAVGSATPLSSLTLNAPHNTLDCGSIATVNGQNYLGPLTLSSDTTMTAGGDISFASTVDSLVSEALPRRATIGEGGLAVLTPGTVTFTGAVGAAHPLVFLDTGAAGVTMIAGPGVTTKGPQNYLNPVRIGFDTTLTASSIQSAPIKFAAAVDGPRALTLSSTTGISLLGPVGATTPLASLTITKGGVAIGGGSVTTSSQQTYTSISLAADLTLSSVGLGPNDITIGGVVGGAHALTVAAGTGNVTFGGAVGAGTPPTALTIASANNVTAADVTAGSFTQLAGSGRTSFSGILTATGLDGVTLTGNAVSLRAVNLARGSLSITVTGVFSAVDGVITAPAGGLTKAGTGDLIVGKTSYTGPTNVTGGSLSFSSDESLPGGLHIGNGASVGLFIQLNPDGPPTGLTITTTSLTFDGTPGAPQGRLDLGLGTLKIQYGNAADPIADIRQEVAAGFNGGTWRGQGITSSQAARVVNTALGFGDGADGVVPGLAPGNLIVQVGLPGDVTLDGKVNFSDLLALAQHFGKSSVNWDQGDLNYDGAVGFADLLILAQHFGNQTKLADTFTTALKRRLPLSRRRIV